MTKMITMIILSKILLLYIIIRWKINHVILLTIVLSAHLFPPLLFFSLSASLWLFAGAVVYVSVCFSLFWSTFLCMSL